MHTHDPDYHVNDGEDAFYSSLRAVEPLTEARRKIADILADMQEAVTPSRSIISPVGKGLARCHIAEAARLLTEATLEQFDEIARPLAVAAWEYKAGPRAVDYRDARDLDVYAEARG